jgi:hypothetical protein
MAKQARLIAFQREGGTAAPCAALIAMFFFYSNGVGLAGSIIASLLLSAILLYACSGP